MDQKTKHCPKKQKLPKKTIKMLPKNMKTLTKKDKYCMSKIN